MEPAKPALPASFFDFGASLKWVCDFSGRIRVIAVGLWANFFEGKSYVNNAYALICYPGTDYEECEAAKKSIEARESSIQMQKDISDIKHDIHALANGTCSNRKLC